MAVSRLTRFKAPHSWSIGRQGRKSHRRIPEAERPASDNSQKPPQIDSETRKIHSLHSDSRRPLLPRLLPLLSRSVLNRFGSVRRISPIVKAYRFN